MRKFTLTYVQEFVKQTHNGECLSDEYVDSTKHLIFKCEHGHIWKTSFSNIQRTWCPKCVHDSLRKTIADCHELARLHNGKCLSETYKDSKTHMIWQCENGHTWKAKYSKIQQNRWCPHSLCEQEKVRQTFLKKYGVDNPQKNKSIQEKTKQTLLKKYGVEHALQYKEFADKAARKINDPSIFHHWKTNEEIICQGSYEKKAVQHLNQNKIDFDWQIPFTLPNGKVYIVDLYLKESKTYVEIKGYFRKDAWEKWNLFLSMHPSSQLWDRNKLKELKIL